MRGKSMFLALIIIILPIFYPLFIVVENYPDPELVLFSIPENEMDTNLPDKNVIDEWMRNNASIAIKAMNEFLGESDGYKTRAINYYVDIKVVYDANAFAWAFSRQQIPSAFFTSMAWMALNFGFGQYWNDMEFHVNLDPNWCVFDLVGCQQPWSTLGELLREWSTDSYGWPAPSSWTTQGTPLAPAGTGHGSYFDLLIMFVNEPLHFGIGGVTWRGHNALLINLAGIVWWSSFSDYGYPGTLSLIMHETGHDYRVMGDTWFQHFDVMDYFWGFFYPHSHRFDSYHQSIIEPVRYMHSA